MMRPSYLLYFIPLLLISCRSNDFEKSPVDELVRDMTDTPVYSIILYDMDEEGSFFKDYKHQYRIIKESKEGATPEEEITDWMPVSEDFFNRNIDNMGMEIAAKSADGTVSKTAAPPGYSNYVGNEKYGQWQQGSNGQSFWAFYGQYALLSSLFNMGGFPARRSYYDGYRGARQAGRPYYGPTTGNGQRTFGTNSQYTTTTKPNTTWRNNPSSRAARSSTQRTSRAGSRYGSGSSSSRMRSRGGGFGK